MPRPWVIFFCILFCCINVSAQVDLNRGLVAYYPFNGNANDASGNNNNPIFNNSSLTTDYFGVANSASLFNGLDNFIQIPHSSRLNFSNSISLCAWVKPQGFYMGQCHGNDILSKGAVNFAQGTFLLRFDDSFITNGGNCASSDVDTLRQT